MACPGGDGAGEVAGETAVALPAGQKPAPGTRAGGEPSAVGSSLSTVFFSHFTYCRAEKALPPFADMGGRRPRRRLIASYHQAECAAKEQVALRWFALPSLPAQRAHRSRSGRLNKRRRMFCAFQPRAFTIPP